MKHAIYHILLRMLPGLDRDVEAKIPAREIAARGDG